MIELYGTVAKEEHVKTVENNILPETFVLENLEPYPGYHGKDLPTDVGPDTFFLITIEAHPADRIFRVSDNVRKKTGYYFNGSPACLTIKNENYNAIRIRDLSEYKRIEVIQKHFIDFGIRFQKKKKIDEVTFIELKKIFKLEWVNDNTLRDHNGIVHYCKLPGEMDWKTFKKITVFVKNNLPENNFDAALVVLYATDVHDLVRIYDKNVSINRLEEIRKKYIEGIRMLT